MPNLIQDPRTVALEDLFAPSVQFQIPLFQRDYSWDADQTDEFVDDMLDVYKFDNEHFLGTLVISNSAPGPVYQGEDRARYVIDGQQRITTSLLLIAVIRHLLHDMVELRPRNHALTRALDNYLHLNVDDELANQKPRITANRQNQIFMDNVFTKQIENSSQVAEMYRHFDAATRRTAAKLYFAYERMNQRMIDFAAKQLNKEINHDARSILDYVTNVAECEKVTMQLNLVAKRMLRKAIFVELTVVDWRNSFSLFDGLNNRGLDLAKRDIIKNIVLAKANDENPNRGDIVQQLEIQWRDLERLIPANRFNKFLRHYLLLHYEDVTLNAIVKFLLRFTESITASEIVRTLIIAATEYEKLLDPSKESRQNISDCLQNLRTLGAERTFPIALAAKLGSIGQANERKVLKALEILYFRRAAICQFDNKSIEEPVQIIAKTLFNAGDSGVQHAIAEIHKLNPTDLEFISQFKLKRDIDRSVAKYLLLEIENFLRRPNHPITGTTLEHIMPVNVDQWSLSEEEKANHDVMLNRIGNLSLFTLQANAGASNRPFAEKKLIYEAEALKINETVVDSTSWNSVAIARRQEQLANHICEIWPRA